MLLEELLRELRLTSNSNGVDVKVAQHCDDLLLGGGPQLCDQGPGDRPVGADVALRLRPALLVMVHQARDEPPLLRPGVSQPQTSAMNSIGDKIQTE